VVPLITIQQPITKAGLGHNSLPAVSCEVVISGLQALDN
jgi:hypothetical protein